MRISRFQFTSPVLLGMEFMVNEGFRRAEGENVNINTNISIRKSKVTDNSATVIVVAEVGEKSDKVPFYISVKEQAKFRWEGDAEQIPEEELNRLLDQNAPALIVGYIRPIVASITNASPYPAFNIPFLDFTEKN